MKSAIVMLLLVVFALVSLPVVADVINTASNTIEMFDEPIVADEIKIEGRVQLRARGGVPPWGDMPADSKPYKRLKSVITKTSQQ